MKKKLILCMSLTLALCFTSIPAFAQSNNTQSLSSKEYQVALEKIENLLEQEKTSNHVALTYMENAVGQEDMKQVINDYQSAYSKTDAYKMVAENLKSTYEEIQANDFTEEQAKALFVSAANLEAGTAEMSKMEFASEIPNFAPSHPEVGNRYSIDQS